MYPIDTFIFRISWLRKSVLSALIEEEIRRENSEDVLYKLTLLLFYFFFTIFSHEEAAGPGCSIFAAINYSLLLWSAAVFLKTKFVQYK